MSAPPTQKLSERLVSDGYWGRTVSFEEHLVSEIRALEDELAAVKAERDAWKHRAAEVQADFDEARIELRKCYAGQIRK